MKIRRRTWLRALAAVVAVSAAAAHATPAGGGADLSVPGIPPWLAPLDAYYSGDTVRLILPGTVVSLDEEDAERLAAALHAPGSPWEDYSRQELFVRVPGGGAVPWADLQAIPDDVREAIDRGRRANILALRGSPPPVGSHAREGPLAGRRVVISPGHGYLYSDVLGRWTTQRGELYDIIEDIETNEIASYYLIPMLERAGAQVFSCRERGITESEIVVDNDGASGYSEDGSWSTGSAPGFGGSYRWADADTTGAATARFRFRVPADDTWPVYARWIASSNRAADAVYEVDHAGGTTEIHVNQQAENDRWLYLGGFAFLAGVDYEVRLTSRSSSTGAVVVADAVRVGGGVGDVVDGGMTSGQPRWKESAWAWVHYVGSVPTGVLDRNDVTIRPAYADWEGADAYLSLHTNGGGGIGTETYVHDTAPSAGSEALMDAVHTNVVHAIRTLWDPAWTDRGQKTANFGELREAHTMPAALIELAFHDSDYDTVFLNLPRFRFDAARAMAIGIQEYLAPGTVPAPLPPVRLAVRTLGGGTVRASWRPADDPAYPDAVPERYRVYLSGDGHGFDDAAPVETTGSAVDLGGLAAGETVYLRVTAVNAGGESFPSEVLGARPVDPPTRILVVNGFDRLDRYVREWQNTFDYVAQHGEAIAGAGDGRYGFDSASNEAVLAGDPALGEYGAVIWILGEESTDDHSFDATERAAVDAYLAGGGNLVVTEGEMGWDLVELGSPETTAWLEAAFHATYTNDDAEVYSAEAVAGGLFDGLGTIAFDDGTHGTYDVNYPDVYSAGPGATEALAYTGVAGGAAVVFDGGPRTVLLGFPFETILGAGARRDVMTRILEFVAPFVEEPVEGSEDGGGDSDAADGGDDGAGADGEVAADGEADAGTDADVEAGLDGGADASPCVDCREECACRAAGQGAGGRWALAVAAVLLAARRRNRR